MIMSFEMSGQVNDRASRSGSMPDLKKIQRLRGPLLESPQESRREASIAFFLPVGRPWCLSVRKIFEDGFNPGEFPEEASSRSVAKGLALRALFEWS